MTTDTATENNSEINSNANASSPTPQTVAKRLNFGFIGKNISAALNLLALSSDLEKHDLYWFQTAKDARTQQSSNFWTLLSQGLEPNLRPESGRGTVDLSQAMLFLEGHRRIPLADLGRGHLTGVAHNYPAAVLRKILSLGLWGDLGPDLWIRHGNRRLPNTYWPHKNTESANFFASIKDMALVHRPTFLEHLKTLAQKRGIHVEQDNKWVLGLRVGKGTHSNQLVMNAPYPAVELDRVLWLSQIDELNEEKPGRSSSLAKQKPMVCGMWKSAGTWVEKKCITALPNFSLWLEPSKEKYFLSTGLHASGLLKRVFALPVESFGDPSLATQLSTQGFQSPVWLQIEELELDETAWVPEFLQPTPSQTQAKRLDAFLWELCPLLQQAKLEFIEMARVDESAIYIWPRGEQQDLGNGVFNICPGKMPIDREFAKQVLTRLKINQS